MYRGLLDYAEYAFQAARRGTPGLQWQALSSDAQVGMEMWKWEWRRSGEIRSDMGALA